jgi:hypothetical protein
VNFFFSVLRNVETEHIRIFCWGGEEGGAEVITIERLVEPEF